MNMAKLERLVKLAKEIEGQFEEYRTLNDRAAETFNDFFREANARLLELLSGDQGVSLEQAARAAGTLGASAPADAPAPAPAATSPAKLDAATRLGLGDPTEASRALHRRR